MKWMTKTFKVLALVLFVLAGHTTLVPSMAIAIQENSKPQVAKLSSVKSISLSGEGAAAELVIALTTPATYTSYKTTAPLRLVLDLSQTAQGTINYPILLNKGNFKTVSANQFDTEAGVLTRIDVELVKDAEAVITASATKPGELRISFPIIEQKTASFKKDSIDKDNTIIAKQNVQTETKNSSNATPSPAETLSQRALSSISVKNDTIILKVDGGVADYNSFQLSKPDRFVIDLLNTTLSMSSHLIPLNTSGIASARIGVYPDKVRVVLDSINGNFPETSVVKSDQGLSVKIISKPEKNVVEEVKLKPKADEAAKPAPVPVISKKDEKPAKVKVEASPEKPSNISEKQDKKSVETESKPKAVSSKTKKDSTVEKADDSKPALKQVTKTEKQPENTKEAAKTPVSTEISNHEDVSSGVAIKSPKADKKSISAEKLYDEIAAVESIDFQVIDGISRVAVKTKGSVSVEQPVKTAGFVTLTIKNATLSKQLQRSFETQSFITPVLRITPLLIKTKKGNDTKIRIAMRSQVPYEYRQEGDMVFVDFKNPEGLTSDKLPESLIEPKVAVAVKPKITAPKQSAKDVELASELAPVADSSPKSTSTGKGYGGRKVTLEFADAEVRKIFQLLSEVSNKNFVLGDDVTGTISIKLVNVPWDQALDIILDTKNLDKREDGNIIIIKGKGKFGTQEAADAENKKNIEKNMPLQPAKVFSVNYAFLADVASQIEKLSSGPKGAAIRTDASVISDARTNKIIVIDTLNRLYQMQALLSEIDVPEKQVMIEARIVEATSTFTRSLGVNWGLHYRDGSSSFMGINQLDTSFGGVASTPAPVSGLSGNSGGAMGISFGTLTSNISVDLRLNAAASAGLVKIVSTPKVATLNNKTAKITQGQQVPYTSSTSDKVETKFIEAALSLEVTPHINANGTISMKIDAKNDSVGQATGGSTAPAINKKQATTEMLLRDGETTVIGGIYVDSDNDSDDGVPYLMDIPFLGKLFKSNSKTKVKTELLIFITPRILNSI